MTRIRQRWLPLLGTLVALGGWTACDDPEPGAIEQRQAFQRALPDPAILSVALPGAERLPRPGTPGWSKEAYEQALETLESGHQRFTLHTSMLVNLGLAAIGGGVGQLLETMPPIIQTDERIVWLSDTDKKWQYALVIEREAADFFRYQLLKRLTVGATGGPGLWRVLMAGEYTPGERAPYGQGAVWLDLNVDHEPATTGKVLALWSDLPAKDTLTVFYYQARLGNSDTAEAPRDAVYHYVRQRDGSGVMVFAGPENVDGGDLGELNEKGAMITRWDPRGAGRSDVTATGGDIARLGFARAVRSECWSPDDYALVYQESWLQRPGKKLLSRTLLGSSSGCPFPEPGSAVLPPLGEAPPIPPPAAFEE